MKSESPLSTLTSADAYKKLGAWVDLYDTCIAGNTDPIAALDEMARRGVRTLYLQTSRWKESHDISHVEKVTAFLDRAQLKGISVVGWYLPGFGDLDRDVRRSLAVMNFVTPQGARFSGFAADLETREEVAQDRNRFNNGIAEYSKRIRAASPPGSILAAIVVDPKNNERAPYCSSNYDPSRCRWEGYPWGDIGSNFDVVMPMAYWSVSRGYVPPKCMEAEINSGEYIKSVASKTESLMGRSRPMHVIGGIADCNTLGEVKSYVDAVIGSGYLGGSLYDFETTQVNPRREEIWAELARLNN